ncbi:MAG: hypothetical protein OXH95_04240 [bacterium]|nr:hypothetical protein [bacterium]MDE0643339.1 hypothetical protein [bacterium]MYD05191.1 hypothetical protein [Acidimicrobiia bacterium]
MKKRVLITAVLALVLAGCGGDEEPTDTPDPIEENGAEITLVTSTTTTSVTETTVSVADEPDPTDEPDPATADEPYPTTTTTAADSAPTPELTEEDVVILRGIGPVTLGMTVDEAVTASGLELTQDFGRASTDSCFYMTALTALPGVAFMVVDGEVVRIEIHSPSTLATRSGVRIGTSESSLREVYSANIQQVSGVLLEGPAWAFVPNDEADADYRIYFAVENGEVAHYRLGLKPAVDNAQGCEG